MVEVTSTDWLQTLRQYVVIETIMHLAWEVVQLPLYVIWSTGTVREITFATLHCTAGDLLIASLCLMIALLTTGSKEWPYDRFEAVALMTIFYGVGYTGYSEWRNTSVTHAWVYAATMPTVFGLGVSPLIQWLVIPSAVFWCLRRKRGCKPEPPKFPSPQLQPV